SVPGRPTTRSETATRWHLARNAQLAGLSCGVADRAARTGSAETSILGPRHGASAHVAGQPGAGMKYAAIVALALVFAPGAQAATWTVDHAHSKLGFVVQWSGQPFTATFQKWDTKIEFDPADLAHAKADVSIDMNSASSGDPDTDQNLPGAEAFEAGK